jgi:hypothetical protein
MEYFLGRDVIKKEQYYLYLLKPEDNNLKIAGSCYGYIHNIDSLIKLRRRVRSKNTLGK